MSQNNVRLLKAISGLQNQVNRLERRQPYEAVSVATRDSDMAIDANVDYQLIFNQFRMNQGIYYDTTNFYWTVMSSGIYSISIALATSPPVTGLQWRLRIGSTPQSIPGVGWRVAWLGNGTASNIFSGTMTVFLPEGWTFFTTVNSTVATTITYRDPSIAQFEAPVITIAQISQAYDPPAEVNEWYFEPTEIEPR